MRVINVFIFLSLITFEVLGQRMDQPNFIIIIADDAAWDDSGVYGNDMIQTPNINKLGEEGLVFDNAFLTTSSCSPSRCSILTGRYPHSTGAPELHVPLPEDQLLFAGELQKVGYYTVAAGKYHIGPPRKDFDKIYGHQVSGCEYWVQALEERPKDQPFFMWLASKDPHRSYEENIIPNPHDPKEVKVPPYLPDNDSVRKDLALYYDEIARLDSYLGKVMEALKEQGVDENTMVIYMTDNGRPFPRDKTRLYDSGIKTPFIVRWPNQVKSGRTAAMISSIDIAPTLCELAGAALPKAFQGISFASVLEEADLKGRDYIVGEHNWHDYQAYERALRTDKFLYIRNEFPFLNASPPADAVSSISYQEMIRLHNEAKLEEVQMDCFVLPRPEEELYDVLSDPFQLNNLAMDDTYAKVLAEMRSKLNTWKKEFEDELPKDYTPDGFNRWTGKRIR
ncbi:sulfatase family protein [Echinicola salinicaeni]|uniref:sulfatase family protein n=1 Tax=Echinicola salinicaeni TaxID=2762757 RepID=UPI001646BB33|nr:sulfatase [Echinicola salinicaeni]